MIKFSPLGFLGVFTVYNLEIFKFEKSVKYANEMTGDVIHSSQSVISSIKIEVSWPICSADN